MIAWLNPGDPFPPAASALKDPNGLVCAGMELNAERVLMAYERGIFPWYSDGQPVLWWSPDPRMVLQPKDFVLHRSLRKVLRNVAYEIRVDQNFTDVMRGCAEPRPEQDGTWITDEIVAAYSDLHRAGLAHSVECWMDQELVGGLYGIALGKVFFGESMFMRRTDASKIAFAHLVAQLTDWGFELIDCQQKTDHLASFGARPIARKDFLQRIERLIHSDAAVPRAGRWQFQTDLRGAAPH
ncbi:MAG: leucyl/phenylalanyl-tRNA--protein transferase [Betaproteobacteria bacterium]|nr:MAG: leucyl/phenylalanyl-tRNA--protein transferase [Betaproteobacteria bacterium]